MTSAKQLFLRKEPGKQSLAEWWVTICHDERFDMVLTHVRAIAMELNPTQEQLTGAQTILELLSTISDNAETITEFPTPGLKHEFYPPKTTEKKED